MLIPVLIFGWYHWQTQSFYAKGLLIDAANYATNVRGLDLGGFFIKGLIGLSFIGGCIIGEFFFLPFLFSRRQLLIHFIGFIAAFFTIALINKTAENVFNLTLSGLIQLALFITLGASLLCIVVIELYNNRGDALICLLFFWIFGVFLFASFINWTINGRSILIMIPAVVIVLTRRIEKLKGSCLKDSRLCFAFILAAFIGLSVLISDYVWANTSRQASQIINRKFLEGKEKVIFQGHWGFQYYMEGFGFKAIDAKNLILSDGLIIIIPENNTNTFGLPQEIVRLREVIEIKPLGWLSVMSARLGAGFYSDIWGPLPFAFGKVSKERYYILQCVYK